MSWLSLVQFGTSLLGAWQRIAIYTLIATTIGIAIWGHGYHKGSIKLYEYQAEQARAAVVIVTKRGAVTEKVITKYIKVRGETQYVTQYVEKEIPVYEKSNPGYCLDGAWRRLHDAASANSVPESPALSDGEIGAPKAAEAISTVTQNYAACHRTADKLDALQEWVREQGKVK